MKSNWLCNRSGFSPLRTGQKALASIIPQCTWGFVISFHKDPKSEKWAPVSKWLHNSFYIWFLVFVEHLSIVLGLSWKIRCSSFRDKQMGTVGGMESSGPISPPCALRGGSCREISGHDVKFAASTRMLWELKMEPAGHSFKKKPLLTISVNFWPVSLRKMVTNWAWAEWSSIWFTNNSNAFQKHPFKQNIGNNFLEAQCF